MKIRLVIVDTNKEYVDLVSSALKDKYLSFLDLAVFCDANQALQHAAASNAHVLLISDDLAPNIGTTESLPERAEIGVLTKESGASVVGGRPALNKFSGVEKLYNFVLKLYAESVKDVKFGDSKANKNSNVFAFVGPNSRTRSDATAIAFAKTLAARGAKVLYVSLHTLTTVNQFFEQTSTPEGTLSNVIFLIKSKRGNLTAQLALATGSADGVNFLVPAKSPADFAELSDEEKVHLIKEILSLSEYDALVFNVPFALGGPEKLLFGLASQIFSLSDGSAVENTLVDQIARSFRDVDVQRQTDFLRRLAVVYLHNEGRKIEKLGSVTEIADVSTIGELNPLQIVQSMINFDIFGVFAARFI